MSALTQPTGDVAASASAVPPPTHSVASHSSPRLHPLTATVCAHCNAEAKTYCRACSQQSYCSKECQEKDWKKHKKLCKKLQAMHRAQPTPQQSQQSEDGVAAGSGEGGGGGGGAAAAGKYI